MNEQENKEKRGQQFLELNQKASRGKRKIYITMNAGVGKSSILNRFRHLGHRTAGVCPQYSGLLF